VHFAITSGDAEQQSHTLRVIGRRKPVKNSDNKGSQRSQTQAKHPADHTGKKFYSIAFGSWTWFAW